MLVAFRCLLGNFFFFILAQLGVVCHLLQERNPWYKALTSLPGSPCDSWEHGSCHGPLSFSFHQNSRRACWTDCWAPPSISGS